MSFSFYNFPKKFELKDYEKVLDTIKKRYAFSDLIAVYDWGTPSVPGISDMDILLIWKDNPKKLPLLKRTFTTFSSKEKYILYHPLMHISEKDFENILYVYPNGTLRKVWGKMLKPKKITKKENEEANACVLNDIIVRHYPRDFLQQCMKKNIDVRGSLLRLNSMKYTFSTMKQLKINVDSTWIQFSREVELLRKNWFVDLNTEKLSHLIEEALDISIEVVKRCNVYQEKRLFNDMNMHALPSTIHFSGIKNNVLFTDSWNKDDALEKMKTAAVKGKIQSILPKSYAKQLIAYAGKNGKISNHIRKHLQPSSAIKNKENSVVGKRIDVLNNQAELASVLMHSDFPAFFDFGYRNKKGINNTLLRISDIFRF